MNKITELNNRFFDELENAIKEAYDENVPDYLSSFGLVVIPAALSKVLKVIGKYNAIPSEPKENEIANG